MINILGLAFKCAKKDLVKPRIKALSPVKYA
jgi:hypothetical protein